MESDKRSSQHYGEDALKCPVCLEELIHGENLVSVGLTPDIKPPVSSEMESPGMPLVVHGDQYHRPVHISAGGTNYTTTLATLTSLKDSKLGKLFNGTLPITLDPINHHYFLDTDGSVFAHTLNFLRYGELVLPDDFSQRPLLLKQARQLEIEPLVDALTLFEAEKDPESEMSEAEDITTSKKKTKLRRRRSKKVCELEKETNNLLRGLEDGNQGFIAGLKQKEKDRQEIDEQICNLIKKLDDTLHTLIAYNGSRLENTLKQNEDKRQKQDEKMDKLMKGLGETLERLMADNGRNIEKVIKMQDQRLSQPTVRPSVRQPGLVSVRVMYTGYGSPYCYRINIMCNPYDQELNVPNGVPTEKQGDITTWKYKNYSLRPQLVDNITSQLIVKGYQLITAMEYTNDPSGSHVHEYLFVRS